MQSQPIRIGTRGSALALAQARETRARLMAAHQLAEDAFEIVVIKTTGDRIQDKRLLEIGGKGLFTKEIEDALLDGAIDFAVHSSKDMPTVLPPGLTLAGFLPREDVRDAFVSSKAGLLNDLPQGAVVGTVSLRRQALAMRLRPDITCVPLRGNVPTRIEKVANGDVDATFLAYAGLKRLNLDEHATDLMDLTDFPPAVGQGAICIETRESDRKTESFLAPILDSDTGVAVACERAVLRVLDGSCRTPIAGHASLDDGAVSFFGMVLSPDGTLCETVSGRAESGGAETLGSRLGQEIRDRLGPDGLAAIGVAQQA